MHRGIQIGIEQGIEIGLAMAAAAARRRQMQIANTAANVVKYATPAVLKLVSTHRAAKAERAAS
jgi:hypothetical protein